jgi:type II secretory pathway pseudopilin PulG
MSLVEVLIASLLLVGSSSAALGVWSQATATWQQSHRLQQQADQLQLLQLASHRWLMRHGAEQDLLGSDSDACQLDPVAVAAALNQAVPLPQAFTRQWVVDPVRLGVWQELSVLNGDGEVLLQRRQLVSPAAYGLCPS